MTVRELRRLLRNCDQDLQVATHAHNHTDTNGRDTRVVLLRTHLGPMVGIGNWSKKYWDSNLEVVRELDGGLPIAPGWPRWDGKSWHFDYSAG